jgi:hypothetical protein
MSEHNDTPRPEGIEAAMAVRREMERHTQPRRHVYVVIDGQWSDQSIDSVWSEADHEKARARGTALCTVEDRGHRHAEVIRVPLGEPNFCECDDTTEQFDSDSPRADKTWREGDRQW